MLLLFILLLIGAVALIEVFSVDGGKFAADDVVRAAIKPIVTNNAL